MSTMTRIAAAAVIGVVAIGGAYFAFGRPASDVGVPGPTPTPTVLPTIGPAPTPTARVDYSDVPGRVLVQHLGNALDGSEAPAPDGNFGTRRFYLMNADGSSIVELLPGTPAGGKVHADISPDGTKVVFTDRSDQPAIHEVNLDGTGYRQISTPCDCMEGDPAYSPDGKSIVFSRAIGDTIQLGIRDLTHTDAVVMLTQTEGILAATGGEAPEQPSWSPDGASIVYQMTTYGADNFIVSSRIRIIDIASRAIRDLPIPVSLQAGEPKYSPDGATILFVSGPAEQTLGAAFGDVYRIQIDGTAMTLLTPDEGTGANWTPDGKHIVFYAQNQIWLMDPDGGNKAPWSATGPDLSTTERGYGYTTYWIPAAP